jgi:TRAP-type C4-dicarboxylate transport system substrate-binding protein
MRQLLPRSIAGLAVALSLLTGTASAEPIRLKLAFNTSDRTNIYEIAIKPFVEAVNAEAKGLIEIEVFFGGVLGKAQALQPQLVLDGTADIAFVTPSQAPQLFPDNTIVEVPGLFRDVREATLVYTRLTAANLLRGYEPFHVIGAFGTDPETIHTRPAISSLNGLQGKSIRVNNHTEGAALEKLGMRPVVMEINQVAGAISRGDLDGAAIPLSMLHEFGIGRVTPYHYLLPISPAPLAVLMNRSKLDSLPAPAQDVIRRFSGKWSAMHYISGREQIEAQVLDQLKSDPRRKVMLPSQQDKARAEAVFAAVTEDVVANDAHLRALLAAAQAEVAKLRGSE